MNSPDPDLLSSLGGLARLLAAGQVLVLTGAGMSTESGIPDYRSPESLRRARQPMMYQEFSRSEQARRRYWARSFRGWPAVRQARPNEAHHSVARLEEAGIISGVITQNVDGLHQLAGSKRVVELHGRLAQVRCLHCGTIEDRAHLQDRLRELNPDLPVADTILAPDGDAEAGTAAENSFRVAACQVCGGVLKPDVVFFGENIPRASLDLAWSMFEGARTLLVLGSSLSVSSGQRFVERAALDNKPVSIINRGPTKGDAQATFRLDGRLGELLPALESALASV